MIRKALFLHGEQNDGITRTTRVQSRMGALQSSAAQPVFCIQAQHNSLK
jgi:hypothetical protein